MIFIRNVIYFVKKTSHEHFIMIKIEFFLYKISIKNVTHDI